MKRLAICMPTYNEKENLPLIVEDVKKCLSKETVETTILIIDGNSPDGTGEIADKFAQQYKTPPFQIRVIHEKGKLGLANAYKLAFKTAIEDKFDYILSMDADFSHQPKYISEFLKAIGGSDLVIGSRNIPGGSVENWSLLRRFISKGGSLYARTILGVNIKDFTGGFNMYTRKAMESINLGKIRSEGYSFAIEMKYRTVKNGNSYKEVPIIFPDRVRGKAKMSKKIFFEAILRVWQIRFSKI